jgi:hypothetical protein
MGKIYSTGIPDAPNDGKQYGRQNRSWSETSGGSGGKTLKTETNTLTITDFASFVLPRAYDFFDLASYDGTSKKVSSLYYILNNGSSTWSSYNSSESTILSANHSTYKYYYRYYLCFNIEPNLSSINYNTLSYIRIEDKKEFIFKKSDLILKYIEYNTSVNYSFSASQIIDFRLFSSVSASQFTETTNSIQAEIKGYWFE